MKSKANLMVLKSDSQGPAKFDWLKWTCVAALVLVGLFANYYYSAAPLLVRMAVGAVIVALAVFIASRTQKGRWILDFFRDSRMELRKVYWPTRQEVTQTTMIVGVMVVVLALVLWGMDGILVWLIGWLTGQRG